MKARLKQVPSKVSKKPYRPRQNLSGIQEQDNESFNSTKNNISINGKSITRISASASIETSNILKDIEKIDEEKEDNFTIPESPYEEGE